MSLREFKNAMSTAIYGMTATEAKEIGICVSCKLPYKERCYSEAGLKEYQISGLCELCFDSIMKEKF